MGWNYSIRTEYENHAKLHKLIKISFALKKKKVADGDERSKNLKGKKPHKIPIPIENLQFSPHR